MWALLALADSLARLLSSSSSIDELRQGLGAVIEAHGDSEVKKNGKDEKMIAMVEQLALADRLARLLSSSSGIDELREGVVTDLKKLVALDWAAIALSDETTGSVHFSPLSRRISSEWELGETISLTGSPVAWLMEEKRVLVEPDLGKASRFWTGVSFLKQGIKSVAYLPLFSRGEVIGGLLTGNRQINAYGERELRLLKYVASQLSLPIENDGLRREMAERAERRGTIWELTRLISSSRESGRVFETFSKRLKKIVPLDYVSIYYVEGQQARVLANYTAVEFEAASQRTYPINDTPVGWVAIHKKTNITPDFSKEIQFAIDELFLKASFRSGICLPLFSEEEVFGALQLCSLQGDAYGEKEQQFLEELAAEIAMPVRNMYLYASVKESEVFAQAVIHELTTHLTPIISSSDMLAEQVAEKAEAALAKLIQNIRQSANAMSFSLSRLRDLGRIRTAIIEEQIEALDMRPVVRQIAHEILPVVEVKRQVLMLEIPPALPQVRAHALSLHQMLLGLLTIASTLAPESGELTLTGTVQRDDLVTEIRFPEQNFSFEDQDSLLHAYERSEADRQYAPELALQLTVSRRLVERQGGRFWIERRPDAIAAFCFSLPIVRD